jgi:O-antigen ligase
VQAVGTPSRIALRDLTPAVLLVAVAVIIATGMIAVGPYVFLPVFGLPFVALVFAYPEYGIALFLSTFLIQYPAAIQGSGLLTINNVLGGIFVILLAYKVYRERDWWFLSCREIQLLAFIILMFYLSDRFNGPDPRLLPLLGALLHASGSMRAQVSRSIFTLFFINFVRTPQHVLMVYLVALVLMVVSAIWGVQGVLHGGGWHGFRAAGGAVIASAVNPNRLAMYSILAIAGLYYLTTWLSFPGIVLLVGPLVGVLGLCVIMTGSRSGLLGLGVCTIAIIVEEGFGVRRLLGYALIASLVVVLAIEFVPARTLERITNLPFTQGGETGEGAGSLSRRGYNWELAVEMFRESPFLGVGIGNWDLARFLRDPGHTTTAPHSSYLLALCEGGIFCLAGYLLLLWRCWGNLQFAERFMGDPSFPLSRNLRWVVRSAKIDLLVLVFFSLFADLWQLVILFWLVGIGIVVRRMVEQTLREEEFAY